ncbi:hypothetical protein RhiirA4_462232 [Rhizophagus irregularis]|uniref:Uncharacterized protein n=1 Tax=Rhizophagus irregularis TaxID=588596 RepID=A0A2I1GKH8_9GLOM|nr:hypothetical protein RhiirA4_462232 [Rhizophagus irregularis]
MSAYPILTLLHLIKIILNILIQLLKKNIILKMLGRDTFKHVIQCEINYIEEIPVFKILFGKNFQLCIKSTQSVTSTANAYLQAFVKVIDQRPIAQNSYQNLATLEPELPHQPSFTSIDENPDINNPEKF